MSHLKLEIKECSSQVVAHLIFDRDGSSANIFDGATLDELDRKLDEIGANGDLTGLVISSAKPSIFIAGADLKSLSSAPKEELEALISKGQNVFDKLAKLKITTVAAIHGACVGGGFELTLACDYRVASDAKATRIGLPESQLGILPAWGGSTRLPILIGLTDALPLILGGKLLKGIVAYKKGLVDALCPMENVVSHAETFLSKGKRDHELHMMTHNPVSVAVIKKKVELDLEKKTRGHYPALPMALDVACKAVRSTHDESLKNERDAILELTHGPRSSVAKHLINIFFLTERSKKLRPVGAGVGDEKPKRVENVTVIGAGVMGAGIAYWLSTKGIQVTLKDINDDALAKGMETIQKLYVESVSRRVFTQTEATAGLDHIYATKDFPDMSHCDLVIEAAVENLELKKKIFADFAERVPAETILATNTSALPITEIAKVISHPERLVGIHFFNPVHRMQLVEVVETEHTSTATLASAVKFTQAIGKLPVVVADSPGFLVNRILMPYLVGAGELMSQGHDIEAIDKAMLDFGMPMGPLRLLDEVGMDVSCHVAETLSEAFPERMSVPKVLTDLVEQGSLGKKSGKGFYVYKGKDVEPNPEAEAMQGTLAEGEKLDIQAYLAGLMREEAQRCLDEKVASCAEDVNFAMIMGTGFAPFRGGPLEPGGSVNGH
ncbi:MAG: 3-hydroxyacyl-CoA dehydrogenase NAD-binding domain-containing protein [Akkermansiaceae bacterium]